MDIMLNQSLMKKDTDIFEVKGWTHVIIEGYCMVNIEYNKKHSPYVYGWPGNKDPSQRGELPNPDYDPNVKPNEKPSYCEEKICTICLGEDGKMCPHFAWAPVEKNVKKKFTKVMKKVYRNEK